MPEDKHMMSLNDLEGRLAQTMARINRTKEPVFVALGGNVGVAIVDFDEYRELLRLADLGIFFEAKDELERDEAEGALVTWDVINEEWKRKDEEWKRKEHG